MYFRRSENIKSREVTGGFLESAPSAPPDRFFSAGAETYYFKSQGGILTGVAYAPPVETGGAYAPSAQRLRTPLSLFSSLCV